MIGDTRMTQPAVRSVLRYFPGALLPLSSCSWRVERLYGNSVESADLKGAVAEAIKDAAKQYSIKRGDTSEDIVDELASKFGIKATGVGGIDASKVIIIEPDTGTLALWPPIFICSKCRTFYEASEEPITHCRECFNRSFSQVGLIQACKECSNYEPLRPPRRMANPDSAGYFVCKNCKGKIRLHVKHRKLSQSRWQCGKCGVEEGLTIHCQHADGFSPMQVLLTTQEPVKPAIISMVYVGGRRIEDAIRWGDLNPYKQANKLLDKDELKHLEDVFSVDASSLLLLNNVTAIICAYGYTTGRGAMVRFFEESRVKGRRYVAYASRNEGSAMLIKMRVNGRDKFTFLHTAEHALVKACHLLAGVQEGVFMGKVFEQDDAIVIYEASESEQGSLEYVFEYKLTRLFAEALRLMFTCKYDCEKACMGCIYIRDPLCHPTMSGYFIPNDKLDRKMVLGKWMKDR